jgi:hypothetical protein
LGTIRNRNMSLTGIDRDLVGWQRNLGLCFGLWTSLFLLLIIMVRFPFPRNLLNSDLLSLYILNFRHFLKIWETFCF